MKNIKSNFKSPQRRKNEENKTTNESTWNIFVARFSFSVLSSLIFVIYFVISLFTSTNDSSKHAGVTLSFILFLKIHVKTSLLESLLNKVASLKTWNFIKKRLWLRYFPMNSPQFFKNHFYRTPPIDGSCWFLLSNQFYPLITLCLLFPSFFSFIIDNCSYGSLLRKV